MNFDYHVDKDPDPAFYSKANPDPDPASKKIWIQIRNQNDRLFCIPLVFFSFDSLFSTPSSDSECVAFALIGKCSKYFYRPV